MPTVRIINVIEEPDGMLCSQRKNRVGDPPNASPAQSRTPPMAKTAARSRLSLIVGGRSRQIAAHVTSATGVCG